jgi:hypothetical protein
MTAAVAAGSMLFLGCLQARATTIFQDNFESAPEVSTAAPLTSGDVDANPVAQIGTWTVANRDGGLGDQVTSYSPPGAHDGNNYGRLVSTTSSEWRAFYTTPQTQDVTTDLWINVHEAGVRLFVEDAAGDIGGWLTWGEGTAGMIGFRYNGAWSDTSVPYTLDTWQHLTVVSHFDTQLMDVTLNGVTETDVPFYGTISDFGQTFVASGGQTQRVYIDDVVAYNNEVPEPASLGLLAVGAASLLVRRRH